MTNASLIKTALFVDFDNIYLSLDKLDPLAAEYFATDPSRWLSWIEQGMPHQDNEDTGLLQPRAILVRRCYLNPRVFFRFRHYFVQSAFTVIDCPSLTQRGKNSADIHMVMDIIDTLDHRTHFDEFIILSGDADFTPVLLKLRAADRRTAILTINAVPQAYKSASDRIITGDEFMEEGLQISPELMAKNEARALAASLSSAIEPVLDAMADKVYEEALNKEYLLATVLPEIFKKFPEFVSYGNWLGFYSLRSLTEELLRRRPELELIEGEPWRIAVREMRYAELSGEGWRGSEVAPVVLDESLNQTVLSVVKEVLTVSPSAVLLTELNDTVVERLRAELLESGWNGVVTLRQVLQRAELADIKLAISADHKTLVYNPTRHHPPAEPRERQSFAIMSHAELRERITAIVKQAVLQAAEPITMARAAFDVIRELGPQVIESEWAGAGSFKQLLQTARISGLEMTTLPHPGYLYDPLRHQLPSASLDAIEVHGMPAELSAFTRRISEITGAPRLAPQQYALVFTMLEHDLQQNSFNLSSTSKAVRDLCNQHGEAVPRKSVWFILQGIIYAGHWFSKDSENNTALRLAAIFRDNVLTLCREAQMELTTEEQSLLHQWIVSEIEKEQGTAEAERLPLEPTKQVTPSIQKGQAN